VFTAWYAPSPYIKQICFVFKGLIGWYMGLVFLVLWSKSILEVAYMLYSFTLCLVVSQPCSYTITECNNVLSLFKLLRFWIECKLQNSLCLFTSCGNQIPMCRSFRLSKCVDTCNQNVEPPISQFQGKSLLSVLSHLHKCNKSTWINIPDTSSTFKVFKGQAVWTA
jgi:hypothetical protein